MLPEHFIEWVYVQTDQGGQRKALKPGDTPEVSFCLGDDKAAAVYAYCNLHGLWMTELWWLMPDACLQRGAFPYGDIVTEREGFFRYTLSIKKQGMQK